MPHVHRVEREKKKTNEITETSLQKNGRASLFEMLIIEAAAANGMDFEEGATNRVKITTPSRNNFCTYVCCFS